MFTAWIKRSSLKKASKCKQLVVEGGPMNLIVLLSLSALLVFVGVFMVQRSVADSQRRSVEQATPTPVVTPTPSMAPAR